jgi:guanidinobutyrase
MDPVEKLKRMMRPAGGGIYTVSTGTSAQLEVQRAIYGAGVAGEIVPRWHQALDRLKDARLVIIGIPSDVGAGIERGANLGPQAIRKQLIDARSWIYSDDRIVDAGDVLVVPQLLHDDMLSPDQLERSRRAIYGEEAGDLAWPVSPLSIAEASIRAIRTIAPNAVPFVLGGDHSVAWPAVAAIATNEMGILHFDAHTDLLEERLGVRYCFATWAYHANELIGRSKRLQQVGLRISRRTRDDWERELDVRQYWMKEVDARPVEEIADEISAALDRAKIRGLYISNDIDGTDPEFARATGTAEPGGLRPETVLALIDRVGARFPIWGTDLVEVAPHLGGHAPGEPAATLETSARYVEAQARVALL